MASCNGHEPWLPRKNCKSYFVAGAHNPDPCAKIKEDLARLEEILGEDYHKLTSVKKYRQEKEEEKEL